jgi:hypothetical protein
MADERLPWFPCEPSKLLGALSAMAPHVGYTYWIVCLRCYETGGACPDSLDALARRTGYSKRVVSDALDALFKTGKLVREAAGIGNPYAAKVIQEMRLRREGHVASGRRGGNQRWEKAKGKQRKRPSHPIDSPLANDSYLHLQEQIPGLVRTNPAPDADRIDQRTKLFREGLDLLVKITGRTQDGCRKLIGVWLRDAADDAVLVRRCIEDADRERVAYPLSWIPRAINVRFARQKGENHGRRDRSSTTAARELVEGIRDGSLSLTPEPRAPSSMRRESEAAARLLPPK